MPYLMADDAGLVPHKQCPYDQYAFDIWQGTNYRFGEDVYNDGPWWADERGHDDDPVGCKSRAVVVRKLRQTPKCTYNGHPISDDFEPAGRGARWNDDQSTSNNKFGEVRSDNNQFPQPLKVGQLGWDVPRKDWRRRKGHESRGWKDRAKRVCQYK